MPDTPPIAAPPALHQRLLADLPAALARDELFVVFEPIVSLASRELFAAEVLLRWTHPRLGPIAPGLFIPLAERGGLIAEVGAWVMARALAAAARLQAMALDLPLSVNVSADAIDSGYAESLLRQMADHRLDGRHLMLELTETAPLRDRASAAAALRCLRQAGVLTLLDDFGTGHAALDYLCDLPLAGLKLDRAFTARVAEPSAERTMLGHLRRLAADLDLRVIVEGIETEAQCQALLAMGFGCGQGYRFGTAMPLQELLRLPRAAPGAQ